MIGTIMLLVIAALMLVAIKTRENAELIYHGDFSRKTK